MASDEDDILLGAPVTATKEARDRDGDGVSDMQERLEGTNPDDASDHLQREPARNPLDDGDPRGDLDRPTFERETAFDPSAVMPEGTSIDTGLAGLTDLDGNPLRTGPNRHGVGDDGLLDGRLDENSPLDAQRDPLAPIGGASSGPQQGGGTVDATFGGTSGGGAAGSFVGGARQGPPPEWGPSGSSDPGNNPDLVSAGDGRVTDGALVDPKYTTSAPAPKEKVDPKEKFVTESGQKSAAQQQAEWLAKTKPKESTDPDADPGLSGGVVLTEADVARVVAVQGGDVDFVEGYGGGPQIEGDAPPVRYNPVEDPGEEGDGSDSTTTATGLPPGTEVSRPVDPRDDILGPPTGPEGGGGFGGDPGRGSVSSAATATVADSPGAPGISLVGAGGGPGIQSTAPSGDDVLGRAPEVQSGIIIPDVGTPIGDSDTVEGRRRLEVEEPVAAVDSAATEDAATAPPPPDLVAAGLAADLGVDPRVANIEPAPIVEPDPGGADLLEGSLREGPDDMLDA